MRHSIVTRSLYLLLCKVLELKYLTREGEAILEANANNVDYAPFPFRVKRLNLELYSVFTKTPNFIYSLGGSFVQTKAVLGVDISKQKLVGSKERHKVFHSNKEGLKGL